MFQQKESHEYSKRYISYLDILGFKSLVEKTETDPDELEAVAQALEWVAMHKESFEPLFSGQDDVLRDRRFYMFSDSICQTVSVTNDSLLALFESISGLCRSLLRRAVLVRGSIVLGEVYEDEQIVFGPGLIHAYMNENKVARYPRILVSEEVLHHARSVDYVVPGRGKMVLSDKVIQDADGQWHLDWLLHIHRIYEPGTKGFRIDSPENYALFKEAVQYLLENHASDQAIQEKIHWFANYFNEVVMRGRKLNVLGSNSDIEEITL